MKASYLTKDSDNKAAMVEKFLDVLALNQQLVFGDATYVINKNRYTKLRRPEALPSEEDTAKLKKYTVSRMQEIVSDPYTL
jgi:hypothetical protein